MTLEQRVQYLERLVLTKMKQEHAHYQIEMFASNDHMDMEDKITQWLRKVRPKRIYQMNFVADGAEFTYCMSILYEPRVKPLPKDRQKGR